MLVLASASPRRRDLLTQAGYTLRFCLPGMCGRCPAQSETPIGYVLRLSREKAEAVAASPEFASAQQHAGLEPILILGADTTVVAPRRPDRQAGRRCRCSPHAAPPRWRHAQGRHRSRTARPHRQRHHHRGRRRGHLGHHALLPPTRSVDRLHCDRRATGQGRGRMPSRAAPRAGSRASRLLLFQCCGFYRWRLIASMIEGVEHRLRTGVAPQVVVP